MRIAKLFRSGRSQALRLPRDLRFPGDKVRIRRHGCAVVLEPIPQDWSWLDNIAGKLDEDFIREAQEEPRQQRRRVLPPPRP